MRDSRIDANAGRARGIRINAVRSRRWYFERRTGRARGFCDHDGRSGAALGIVLVPFDGPVADCRGGGAGSGV
jgi:hypothetical protein